MIITYEFYNPETHRDEDYEWDCDDSVFDELVDYYIEIYGVEYEKAIDELVNDDELRERIFDEAYDGLKDMFECNARECFLKEIVYSW